MLLFLGSEIMGYINFLLHKFRKFLIFYNYVFIKYFNICLIYAHEKIKKCKKASDEKLPL